MYTNKQIKQIKVSYASLRRWTCNQSEKYLMYAIDMTN